MSEDDAERRRRTWNQIAIISIKNCIAIQCEHVVDNSIRRLKIKLKNYFRFRCIYRHLPFVWSACKADERPENGEFMFWVLSPYIETREYYAYGRRTPYGYNKFISFLYFFSCSEESSNTKCWIKYDFCVLIFNLYKRKWEKSVEELFVSVLSVFGTHTHSIR